MASAVLGGSLIWLTYSLNLFPNQLERKIQSKTPEQRELESLKSEVRSLGEQLPQTARVLQGNQNKLKELETELKTLTELKIQNQLAKLETQAQNLETSVNKRYQALTVLVQALQDRVGYCQLASVNDKNLAITADNETN